MSEEDSAVASITYKRRRNGLIEVAATGTFSPTDLPNLLPIIGASTTLTPTALLIQIPSNLPHELFKKLIHEINAAYSYQLYTSTYVCLRKLFESLLIELLRVKFGTTQIDMYYWADRGRFHDFSILIENLENNVGDFRQYTSSFNQDFFTFLKNFRERASNAAHSIDILLTPNNIDKIKDMVNHNLALLCNVIGSI